MNRILFLAAGVLWLRAAVRVCAGRWLSVSGCHLWAASFIIATGRWADFWWIGVGLTFVMVVAWFKWGKFRDLRAAEAEYERDGL